MHAVVHSVPRDQEADVGDVEHRRVIGVGVAHFEGLQSGALKFETLGSDHLDIELPRRELAREDLVPEAGPELRRPLALHHSLGGLGGVHGGLGEPLDEGNRPQPVVGVPVRDVDALKLAVAREHPSQHGVGLCRRHRWIDEDRAPAPLDQGARDRRPHSRTAVGQGTSAGLGDLRLDVDLVVQLVLHRASPMRVAWSAGATSWPHGRLISPDGTHTGRGPDRE